jgi:hypothetical protein
VVDSFGLEQNHAAIVILLQSLRYLSHFGELLVVFSSLYENLLLMPYKVACHLFHPLTILLFQVLKPLHQQLNLTHPCLCLTILPKAKVQF